MPREALVGGSTPSSARVLIISARIAKSGGLHDQRIGGLARRHKPSPGCTGRRICGRHDLAVTEVAAPDRRQYRSTFRKR